MKRYLLDTCAISDARGVKKNAGLVAWLAQSQEETLYLSVITIGEIYAGIENLPVGDKRDVLDRWLHDDILPRFEGRIFAIDGELMPTWGRFQVAMQRRGFGDVAVDMLIAATVARHDLSLVTRNVKDFAGTGIPLINPWS